jgi:hypothetical protein
MLTLFSGGAGPATWPPGVAPERKLSYHPSQTRAAASRRLHASLQYPRQREREPFAAMPRGDREGGMEILLISAGVLAAVWIVVLWGSRYFGPQ